MNKMSLGKKAQWSINFAVLAIFSIVVLGNITGFATQRVLAESIKNDEMLKYGQKFAVFGADEPGEVGFFQRFSQLLDKGMICAVTEEEFLTLSETSGAETDLLSVEGEDVGVVKVSGDELKQKDIDDMFGDGSKCQPIKSDNIFYMLASFTVS